MNEFNMFHLNLTKEQGAKYAILPGDPGRAPKIAALLDGPKQEACNREFNTWSGNLRGERVLVTSTGIGGPSAAIAVEELSCVGVKTFLRVGTCGGMDLDVESGDLIIATGAVRAEGTSKEYAPTEFPAVADFSVVSSLVKAAESENVRYHTGVVQSKDSFYGQHSPSRMPTSSELLYKWDAWIKEGCLASEMECAAVMIVASALKARAGAILLAIWNQERAKRGLPNPQVMDTEKEIKTAVHALGLLIEEDKEKNK